MQCRTSIELGIRHTQGHSPDRAATLVASAPQPDVSERPVLRTRPSTTSGTVRASRGATLDASYTRLQPWTGLPSLPYVPLLMPLSAPVELLLASCSLPALRNFLAVQAGCWLQGINDSQA